MRRTTIVGAVAYGVIVFATCAPHYDLAVEQGADPLKPTFVVGPGPAKCPSEPTSLRRLRVQRCDRDASDTSSASVLWEIDHESGKVAPKRIVYGELPAGFEHVRGPVALEPGQCYIVSVQSTGFGGEQFRTPGGPGDQGPRSDAGGWTGLALRR